MGDEQGVTEWIGPNTRVIDAGGHTVLPGLIDTHIHAAEGALSLGGCTLNNKELKITRSRRHHPCLCRRRQDLHLDRGERGESGGLQGEST